MSSTVESKAYGQDSGRDCADSGGSGLDRLVSPADGATERCADARLLRVRHSLLCLWWLVRAAGQRWRHHTRAFANALAGYARFQPVYPLRGRSVKGGLERERQRLPPAVEAHLSDIAATWRGHTQLSHAANRARKRGLLMSSMPLTFFLVAAIILAALYLRRMPLTGLVGAPRPVVVGPVGGGMPTDRPRGLLSP